MGAVLLSSSCGVPGEKKTGPKTTTGPLNSCVRRRTSVDMADAGGHSGRAGTPRHIASTLTADPAPEPAASRLGKFAGTAR